MNKLELEESRRALLSYYNSESLAHGGLIITVAIAFMTLLSQWGAFRSNVYAGLLFCILVSLIIGVSSYLLGRTLFWGLMAHVVLQINRRMLDDSPLAKEEKQKVERKEMKDDQRTPTIFLLQKTAIWRMKRNSFKENHYDWFISKFENFNYKVIIIVSLWSLLFFVIGLLPLMR